jgi:CspA family cold shock protein
MAADYPKKRTWQSLGRTGDLFTEKWMPIGTVKWYNPVVGYGFIKPDNGSKLVIVRMSAVQRSDLSGLAEGQKIHFDIERSGQGRPVASNLRAD